MTKSQSRKTETRRIRRANLQSPTGKGRHALGGVIRRYVRNAATAWID
jgi:hypothetical protein